MPIHNQARYMRAFLWHDVGKPIGLHILTVWNDEHMYLYMYISEEWKVVEICSPMGCTIYIKKTN